MSTHADDLRDEKVEVLKALRSRHHALEGREMWVRRRRTSEGVSPRQ